MHPHEPRRRGKIVRGITYIIDHFRPSRAVKKEMNPWLQNLSDRPNLIYHPSPEIPSQKLEIQAKNILMQVEKRIAAGDTTATTIEQLGRIRNILGLEGELRKIVDEINERKATLKHGIVDMNKFPGFTYVAKPGRGGWIRGQRTRWIRTNAPAVEFSSQHPSFILPALGRVPLAGKIFRQFGEWAANVFTRGYRIRKYGTVGDELKRQIFDLGGKLETKKKELEEATKGTDRSLWEAYKRDSKEYEQILVEAMARPLSPMERHIHTRTLKKAA